MILAVPMGGSFGQTKMSELEQRLKAKGFDVSRAGAKPKLVTRPAPKPAPKKPVPRRPAPRPVARVMPKPAVKKPAPKPVAAKPSKSPSLQRLQQALGALGRKVGDRTLAAVVADGFIGPKTVAATNLALRKYAKAGPQAPAAVRSGTLTPQQVATDAATLASFIELEAQRKVVVPTKAVAAMRPAVKPAAKPSYNIGVAKLQHTINSLAQRTGDSALTLKVDGIIGPRTVVATNRALSRYATTAPAEARTGRLTTAEIVPNSVTLAEFIEAEVTRRLPSEKAPAAQARKAAPKRPASEIPHIRIEKELPPGEEVVMPTPPQVPPPTAVTIPEAAAVPSVPEAPPGPDDVMPPSPGTMPAEKKPFPVGWVVGGAVGVLGIGTAIYFATRKKSRKR